MTHLLSLAFITPLVVGLLSSLLVEALLSPRPRPFWLRGIAANSVHLGSWLLLFGVFLLILQRPWFAVVFILSLQLVVVQSSNTKSQTLNEPFICHDFEYFWDAILHPRLYVPFFGVGLAIAASSAGAVAIGSFVYFESSLVGLLGGTTFMLTGASIAVSGALLIWLGWRKLAPPTLAPITDLDQLGLFASLWAYGIALMRSSPLTPEASPFYTATQGKMHDQPGANLPNVVLVQSESFFDPRPWCSDIAPNLLAHFDATREQAIQHGKLSVPAWGANTVRTECAVLTGVAPSTWGARQFNPYRSLSRHPLPSVASAFKAQGYQTVCIHPYPASFYMRDSVMPQLGFDQFIDISEFDSQDKHGQYIGDHAVARKVAQLLSDDNDNVNDNNRPLFIFVITMENHGPLHLEAPDQTRMAATLPHATWPLAAHLRDLAVYLHHLAEADQMLASVKTALTDAQRPGLLGWYGDHVPILPAAYTHYSPPAGTTPYLLWSTQAQQPQEIPTRAQTHVQSPLRAQEPYQGRSHDQWPAGHEAGELAAHELGVQLFKQTFGRDINSDMIKAEPEPQEQE